MATAVQIEVLLDESGAVQGVQKVQQSIKNLGDNSKPVWDRMVNDQNRAHEATLLLAQTIGVQMPRSLERLLAELPGVGTALSTAFDVGAVLAITAAVGEFITNIDAAKQKLYSFGLDIADALERATGIVTGLGNDGAIRTQKEIEAATKALLPFENTVYQLQDKVQSIGKEGLRAIAAQSQEQLSTIREAVAAINEAAAATYGPSSGTTNRISDYSQQLQAQAETAIEQQKDAQILKFRQELHDRTIQLQADARQAGLTGIAALVSGEQAELAKLQETFRRQGLLPSDADVQDQLNAIRAKTTAQIEQSGKDFKDQIEKLAEESAQSGLQGVAAIEAQVAAKQADLTRQFNKEFGASFIGDPNDPDNLQRFQAWFNAYLQLQNGLNGVARTGARERTKIETDATDQTIQAEEEAAAAAAPPWLRSNVEIANSYQDRVRQLQQQLNETTITESDAAQRSYAAWIEYNAKIAESNRQLADQLAGQLQDAFDQITSGNIGQYILKQIEHFFFEILARWLLTLSQIKSASAGIGSFGGGGGLLGGVLGSLFGLSGAASGQNPISSIFGVSGAASSSAFPTGIFAGAGSSSVIGPNGQIFTPSSATISAGAGTAAAAAQQHAQSTLLGSLAGSALSKVFPHGLTIAGKTIPGSVLGVAGAELGLASIFGAYGSGNPIVGGIGGGIGGALTGLAVGGPVGAAIGAVVGGLAGVFGGIFGRRKREEQAWGLVLGTTVPAIQKTVDDFKNFNLDYQGALDQLTQIESNAKQALSQYGKTGEKIFEAGVPYRIRDATNTINQYEKDREFRSAIDFGAPQFAAGGYVGFGFNRTPSGGFPAILHPGEFVINPAATRQNRATLETINRGGNAQPQNVTFSFIDTNGLESWLQNRGGRMIKKALRGENLRYSGGNFVV